MRKRMLGMFLMSIVLLGSVSARAQSIVGSWDVVVSSSVGEIIALYTFASDGTFTMAGDAPGVRTPGHGVWADLGDSHFALTFRRLRYDPVTGQFAARLKARSNLVLDQTCNHFEGVFQLDVYNPRGELTTSITGTFSGTRMDLELLDG